MDILNPIYNRNNNEINYSLNHFYFKLGGISLKEHCIHLLQYDHWATLKLLKHVQHLPEDLFHKPTESVFPSIAKTFFHMYRGDRIWMKRSFPKLILDESLNEFKDIAIA